MADTLAFEHHRFGPIEVLEADLLNFPGLPGFPEANRFVVMEHDRGGVPFAWLVSVDDPDLALAIADPWQFFPDYRPPVERHHLRALGVEDPEDLQIVAIGSFAEEQAHLNLAAPLLINPRTRRGLQAVFDQTDYSTRERVPAAAQPEPREG